MKFVQMLSALHGKPACILLQNLTNYSILYVGAHLRGTHPCFALEANYYHMSLIINRGALKFAEYWTIFGAKYTVMYLPGHQ